MLFHVLDRAAELVPAAVHVVYGYGAEQVHAACAGRDVSWCMQAEQLGTGHAVAQALADIPDDHRVLILCGDVPLVGTTSLHALADLASAGELSLLTTSLTDPTGYGRVLRGHSGEVIAIVEEQDASDEQRRVDEINTGLMAAGASELRAWLGKIGNDNAQGEYYLTDVIAMAVEEGVAVHGIPVADSVEVMGINDKAQLATAERCLQRKQAEELMEQGVTLSDPARIDVRGSLSVGADVSIDINAIFYGSVSLADGVSVGPNCMIKDAELGPGTVVHANTVIDGASIGANCELGPFARLRPGTELAARVKVGNFVEIKNSRVADGSKINHLSYIGDATLGSGVNIGAGTITCNYDGVAKHRTIIGDDVFVGAGVRLVAPVEVGDGATIGAGSTLTRDAPAGQLSLARARQTSVQGWRRPVKQEE